MPVSSFTVMCANSRMLRLAAAANGEGEGAGRLMSPPPQPAARTINGMNARRLGARGMESIMAPRGALSRGRDAGVGHAAESRRRGDQAHGGLHRVHAVGHLVD